MNNRSRNLSAMACMTTQGCHTAVLSQLPKNISMSLAIWTVGKSLWLLLGL